MYTACYIFVSLYIVHHVFIHSMMTSADERDPVDQCQHNLAESYLLSLFLFCAVVLMMIDVWPFIDAYREKKLRNLSS